MTHRRKPHLTPLDRGLILNAYKHGMPAKTLARVMNRNKETIYAVLRYAGIQRKTGPIPHGTRPAADHKTRDARVV